MGSGRVYLPNFPPPRPLRITLTSPVRKTSVYDLKGDTKTQNDHRKPQLLRAVVFEEEMRDIVSRLTRPTMASRMRAINFRPETQYTYVDMGSYKWSKMQIYADYQRHMYNNNGSVRSGFKRTVKANYRPFV
ncbi:uncharacterized protein LOC101860706 [Aplysia californica]|uniref:Uncharacterized protein LOC101860706 n=1 Tax=Aplysia californica TaxID=6500 RepID=A0ABM0K8Y6_APLCA|nr:uncharacterized protein LOC101860706 [Aplysia californica]